MGFSRPCLRLLAGARERLVRRSAWQKRKSMKYVLYSRVGTLLHSAARQPPASRLRRRLRRRRRSVRRSVGRRRRFRGDCRLSGVVVVGMGSCVVVVVAVVESFGASR